jgi:TrmH family RNA methyltransferase
MLSSNNARLAAARRLTARNARRETGRFLAEGAQAVREALEARAVVELFATADAIERHPDLTSGASEISAKDAAALSETVTPQGLVAVCRAIDVPLEAAFSRRPTLVAALVDSNDPGNAGTILRTADAAGAGAVVFIGGVDPYNGKAVRASAGSLFHLDVVLTDSADSVITAARDAGMAVFATSGAAAADLYSIDLGAPTLWLFGNEARGLPEGVVRAADCGVAIPIYGRAESLNLAAAASVCLYATAHAQRIGD